RRFLVRSNGHDGRKAGSFTYQTANLMEHRDIQQAYRYQQQGKFSDAEAIYQRLLSQAPNEPRVLHLLGLLKHASGRKDEGLALLRRSVELAPQAADFHNHLADT